jgi:site-specific recombinase XerD
VTLNHPVAGSSPARLTNVQTNQLASTSANFLLEDFIKSRRQGISPQSIRFYRICLKPFLSNYPLTSQGINAFLSNLKCGNAKHAYYRAIRAFCNWAVKEGHMIQNPLVKVDVPKVTKRILPSLTSEQVECVIEQAETLRDKAIVSLFADSGMRLSELTNTKPSHIDWDNRTITIWGKGGKQRKAPFTDRTARLFKEYLAKNGTGGNIWHLNTWGIISVLRRLEQKTGLPCNPHTFRRTFASNLHRAGLDVEHIMRLGGWESLDMVLRYTRSVKFEESLRLYHEIQS